MALLNRLILIVIFIMGISLVVAPAVPIEWNTDDPDCNQYYRLSAAGMMFERDNNGDCDQSRCGDGQACDKNMYVNPGGCCGTCFSECYSYAMAGRCGTNLNWKCETECCRCDCAYGFGCSNRGGGTVLIKTYDTFAGGCGWNEWWTPFVWSSDYSYATNLKSYYDKSESVAVVGTNEECRSDVRTFIEGTVAWVEYFCIDCERRFEFLNDCDTVESPSCCPGRSG